MCGVQVDMGQRRYLLGVLRWGATFVLLGINIAIGRHMCMPPASFLGILLTNERIERVLRMEYMYSYWEAPFYIVSK